MLGLDPDAVTYFILLVEFKKFFLKIAKAQFPSMYVENIKDLVK